MKYNIHTISVAEALRLRLSKRLEKPNLPAREVRRIEGQLDRLDIFFGRVPVGNRGPLCNP